MLVAFKAHEVTKATLLSIRSKGTTLFNYFPDTSPFAHGGFLEETLPLYDRVFSTKRFWESESHPLFSKCRLQYLAHGYDPEVHFPCKLAAEERALFGSPISFIATHTAYKEHLLAELLSLAPGLDLAIWGSGWNRCKAADVKKRVKGYPLTGSSYVKAINAAKIVLAIMSGKVTGTSKGDETTTRTFEIPACGGFMLHERTAEVLSLFEEGDEIGCFGSVQELAEKVNYFLAHDQERLGVAQAGHRRCVPAYSYENRMLELLSTFRSLRR